MNAFACQINYWIWTKSKPASFTLWFSFFLCINFWIPANIQPPPQNATHFALIHLAFATTYRVGSSNFGPSPLSSRHGSQESLRHLNTMGSMSMLQTPTSSVRDSVSAAQKKKSIKSSLGRFFSKKEKVRYFVISNCK